MDEMPQHFGKQSGSHKRFSGPKHTSHKPFHKGGFRGARPPFRGGGAQKRGGYNPPVFSDVSKFINKAVITEVVEQFVPEHAFADFALDARLKKNIADKG